MRRVALLSLLVATTASAEPTPSYAEQVAAKVREVYMTGLRRCHGARRAEPAPSARTVRAIEFIVKPSGAATATRVDGGGATLRACVKKAVRSWRFTPPRDGDGNLTSATFELPLNL